MDIKTLIKSIEDNVEFKGITVEVSNTFNKKLFNLYEEMESDNIRTYIRSDYMNSNMFVYHFLKCLEENKINISFNENATWEDVDYFKRLSEEMNE